MFRLDINGLRFIAVSMVVLFHFKFGFFMGVMLVLMCSLLFQVSLCKKYAARESTQNGGF